MNVSFETRAISAMREYGLDVNTLTFDDVFHRVPTFAKANAKNGSYKAFSDGCTVIYWDYSSSEGMQTVTAKEEKSMTASERSAHKQRIAEAQKAREEEQAQAYADAANRAQDIFSQSIVCTSHPYLTAKGVSAVSGLKLHNGALVVSIQDKAGKVTSLQFIQDNGDKRFLSGGLKRGGYFPIGKDTSKPLVICEGLATGLSLYECLNYPVLVAFDAGNLSPVAQMARSIYPNRDIILAADNDTTTDGNPGVSQATKAALAVEATIAIPRMNGAKVDWNDLYQKMGAEEVKLQFGAHHKLKVPEEREEFLEAPIPFDGQDRPKLDTSLLPSALQIFVDGVADAVQVPTELVFMNAICSMAIAVQGKAEVFIHDDYREPLNIYALAALPPGERKSAVVSLCKQPLLEWEQQAYLQVKDVRQSALADRKSLEKMIEGKRNKLSQGKGETKELLAEIRQLEADLPDVPELPRLFVDDATPEAITALLGKQGERIGIQEAEGGIFDILAGRYNSGAANIDLFLKAWSGEPVTVDRRHGEPLRLKSPMLTVCISPQPDVIAQLADKPGFRGRGLLARFFYLLPSSRVGFRDTNTQPIPPQVKAVYANKVTAALTISPILYADGTTAPHRLTLSIEADAIRKAFAEQIECNLRNGGELEGIIDWANKLPGNTTRLAGLLHFFNSHSPTTEPIAGGTMKSAVYLTSLMVDHAKAAFALMGENEKTAKARRILEWIKSDIAPNADNFTGRECWQKVRRRFDNMADVKATLDILGERGFISKLERTDTGKTGRPSEIWKLHPSLLGGTV